MRDEAKPVVGKTAYYRRRPGPSTLALTVRTALLAGIATLAVGAALALQMARGNDPALGAGASQADAQRARVVKTTVVKRIVPSSSGAGSTGSGSTSSGSSYSAPAPAPAPVTSSAS